MSLRERFRAAMAFEETDIPCHVEHGFWDETYERWRGEGLDPEVGMPDLFSISDQTDLFKHFGVAKMGYIRPHIYFLPPFKAEVIEETPDYVIIRDGNGVTAKTNKRNASVPQYLDFPVKSRRDYERVKERLQPDIGKRYPDNWSEVARDLREQDHALVCTHMDGFFAFPREIMGLENMLMGFYDDPALMRDIISDRVDFYVTVYEKAIRDTQPDFAFIWEDMCYKNGPLLSPAFFREFLLPAYKKLTGYLRDMGIDTVIVDSDGDVLKLIDLWLEGGVTGLLPFEVKAGMDVLELGREFPTLQIIGGIDKLEIAKGGSHIDEELRRVIPAMVKRGGYCVSLDHWVPPDISLSDFEYYVSSVREFSGKA